jgi:hypothetical protein
MAYRPRAMASIRQLPSGRWQLRVDIGRDPLTSTRRWATKTVDATGKRDARHQANAWEVDLREQDAPHPRGTFGDLAEQWIAVKERRWPPNTLQEHRGRCMMSTLRRSRPTPSTFSTRSSPLGAARVPTGRAPQRPARSTVRAVDARSASVLRARTRAPARTGRHVTTSHAGTAHRCRPPAFIGYIPWCALRSVRL